MLETSSLSPLTHSPGSPDSGTGPTHRGRPSPPHWCNQNSLPLASLDVHPLTDPSSYELTISTSHFTAPPLDITVLPSLTLCFRDGFLFAHQIHHLFLSSSWCLVRQKNGFGLCLEFVRKSEPWEVSPWSALPSCLLSCFKVFWTIWGSCHLVTDFVFWCSSVEQYWGVVVKQRNSWRRHWEPTQSQGRQRQTQRLQGDRVRSPCLRFASYLLWPV